MYPIKMQIPPLKPGINVRSTEMLRGPFRKKEKVMFRPRKNKKNEAEFMGSKRCMNPSKKDHCLLIEAINRKEETNSAVRRIFPERVDFE